MTTETISTNTVRTSEELPPDIIADKEADELRDLAYHARKLMNEENWPVSEALYFAKKNPQHVQRWTSKIDGRQYTGWLDWGEHELQYCRSKLYELVKVWDWFQVKHPLPPELDQKLRALDWTRARELVGIVTAQNAEEWIIRAQSVQKASDLCDLTKSCVDKPTRSPRGGLSSGQKAQGEKEVFRPLSFRLADTATDDDDTTQFALVDQAITKAMEIAHTDRKGHALTLICTEFLANINHDHALRLITTLARTLKGHHVAVCDDDGELVIGPDAFNKMRDRFGIDPGDKGSGE